MIFIVNLLMGVGLWLLGTALDKYERRRRARRWEAAAQLPWHQRGNRNDPAR